MRRLIASIAVAACAALSLAGVAAPVSAAAGGNSTNAKTCQKGGWQRLYRLGGSTFANQGECVSYGAQGGAILPTWPACFDSSTPTFTDVEVVALIDTYRNATQYISEDGSCSGQVITPHGFTIVEAADQTTADGKCAALEGAGSDAVGNMATSFGYVTAPPDWWPCHYV